MKDDDVDLWLGITLGFMLGRFGSDSRLVGIVLAGAATESLTELSMVLKAFNLSLKLLSGSIKRTGVCSLPDFESSKLASFCFILSEISEETLRAG